MFVIDRQGDIQAEFTGEDRDFLDELAPNFRRLVEPLLVAAAERNPTD